METKNKKLSYCKPSFELCDMKQDVILASGNAFKDASDNGTMCNDWFGGGI